MLFLSHFKEHCGALTWVSCEYVGIPILIYRESQVDALLCGRCYVTGTDLRESGGQLLSGRGGGGGK